MSHPLDTAPAEAEARQRWSQPFPAFTSGHDPRSSDAALLALLHGGVAHAARHDWLNAGRRLIDRTYVDILWHVQQLTAMRAVRTEQVAAALDDFIRGQLASAWPRLPGLTPDAAAALATDWVERLAASGFGSLYSEAAASRLLFFLVPQLPLFNLSRGHVEALRHLGRAPSSSDYREVAAAATQAFAELQPRLAVVPLPTPVFGDAAQRDIVDAVLQGTDWWQRRVFDAWLRQVAQAAAIDTARFGCDDGGGLLA